eukprot:scaffold305752_cov30-Tisochrysis_lutea.AAC.5
MRRTPSCTSNWRSLRRSDSSRCMSAREKYVCISAVSAHPSKESGEEAKRSIALHTQGVSSYFPTARSIAPTCASSCSQMTSRLLLEPPIDVFPMATTTSSMSCSAATRSDSWGVAIWRMAKSGRPREAKISKHKVERAAACFESRRGRPLDVKDGAMWEPTKGLDRGS